MVRLIRDRLVREGGYGPKGRRAGEPGRQDYQAVRVDAETFRLAGHSGDARAQSEAIKARGPQGAPRALHRMRERADVQLSC